MLYNKWWKSPGLTCNRDDKNKEGKANALGLANIGGVFVVLLCGLAVAIITAVMEFCINSRKHAQTDRVSSSLSLLWAETYFWSLHLLNYGNILVENRTKADIATYPR